MSPALPSSLILASCLATLLGTMALLAGCGVDSETLGSLTEMVDRVSQTSSAASQGNGEIDGENTFSAAFGAMGGEGENTPSGARSSAAKFKPPYPDRANPFRFPSDAETAGSANPGTAVADIQVMGFADVAVAGGKAQRRVLLKTNAGMQSLSVGQRSGGMLVLRINEPAVELQLGSLIWTATMFDR